MLPNTVKSVDVLLICSFVLSPFVSLSGATDTQVSNSNDTVGDGGAVDDFQNITSQIPEQNQNYSSPLEEGQDSPLQISEDFSPKEDTLNSSSQAIESIFNSTIQEQNEDLTLSTAEELQQNSSSTNDSQINHIRSKPQDHWTNHLMAARYMSTLAALYVIICIVLTIKAGKPIIVH